MVVWSALVRTGFIRIICNIRSYINKKQITYLQQIVVDQVLTLEKHCKYLTNRISKSLPNEEPTLTFGL